MDLEVEGFANLTLELGHTSAESHPRAPPQGLPGASLLVRAEAAILQVPNPRGLWLPAAQEALQLLLSVALPFFQGSSKVARTYFSPPASLSLPEGDPLAAPPRAVSRGPLAAPTFTSLGKASREEKKLSQTGLQSSRLPVLWDHRPRRATGMEVPKAPLSSSTMKTPRKQQLEALAALQFVLTFLFMGTSFTLLVLFLLFTSFWSLSVLYFVWLYLDWDTPNQGGRRSEWIRNWTVWKHLRDYFPIKLVKTAELPPTQNYVMGAHPHGIMTTGFFCNFNTESNAFSQKFPGLRPSMVALAGLFRLPIFRDYIMLSGLCPVSRQSLDFILSQPQRGQAVVIIVGGAQESLYSGPGQHCVVLRKRKGFVHLALQHGASLVPVYSFGENDVFKVKTFATDSWQYLCQTTFKKLMGFAPCIFSGRGLFSANSWGLMPFAVPITTVVGRPIQVPQRLNPTKKEVDHYHMLYMKALEQLFEEHKESCGVSASTRLTFM
ncbi:PREDICTED: 2-acylglycerol O-acyltransferase 3 [Chrysochloris asiatica]|uniref:Acyltransferase n=1 Tax=Chrysochloris asiatica TaxID=185453 RepID=A0A9B0T9V2_CHRAS|nr:PREDICTED: 2-acylglycerol O-acyltransferase 3 [Chrysochloris asiatica]